MRAIQRRRRYVSQATLAVGRPLLEYNEVREAYVLRLVGRRMGPVLRAERRRAERVYEGPERRRSPRHAAATVSAPHRGPGNAVPRGPVPRPAEVRRREPSNRSHPL